MHIDIALYRGATARTKDGPEHPEEHTSEELRPSGLAKAAKQSAAENFYEDFVNHCRSVSGKSAPGDRICQA
jgi:hypothetical protein